MESIIDRLSVDVNQLTAEYTTPNPPHRHLKWELVIFENGVAVNVVNGKEYTVSRGDIFLLSPLHLHEIRFKSATHLHRDIYFGDDDVEQTCAAFSPNLFQDLKYMHKLLHLHMEETAFETVCSLCKNIDTLAIARLAQKSGENRLVETGLAKAILALAVGAYTSGSAIDKIETPPALIDILQKLRRPEFFTKDVESIIAETHYSHSHFLKLFREYAGVSIVKYLNLRRMEYAAELLRHTDDSCLSICEKCGYCSLSFFIKSFTQKYGVTPLKYRVEQKAKQKTNSQVPPA